MAIYEYREGDLASGFVGLRVAVMVNRRSKQRYFTYAKKSWKRRTVMLRGDEYEWWESVKKLASRAERKTFKIEAIKVEKKLLDEQARYAKERDNQAIPTCRQKSGTGVRGIQIVLEKYSKNGRLTGGSRRVYRVQGSHKGEPFIKTFVISASGWINTVTYLAKKKQLTRWKHLLKRRPCKKNL